MQIDLPNFPTEVLSDWLLPYAKTEGWPPSHGYNEPPQKRWRYLLRNKPLSYWRSLSWEKIDRHISIHDLDIENKTTMVQMVLGAVKDHQNMFTMQIPNLKDRFFSVVSYLREHGTIPKPPIIIKGTTGLSIIDGNHRMAAYFYSYGYLKLEIDDDLLFTTKEIQTYWIAECPLF